MPTSASRPATDRELLNARCMATDHFEFRGEAFTALSIWMRLSDLQERLQATNAKADHKAYGDLLDAMWAQHKAAIEAHFKAWKAAGYPAEFPDARVWNDTQRVEVVRTAEAA